jgi:hypothetical protein
MSQARSESWDIGPLCALLAHRAWNPPTSSSLAEEKRLRAPPQHGGARFPMLGARWRDLANICRFRPMW